MVFETLTVSKEAGVLFAEIAAPPMKLGPELIRDLVSLMQQAEFQSRMQAALNGASRRGTRSWSCPDCWARWSESHELNNSSRFAV